MSVKIELADDTWLVHREDLKGVLKEVVQEMKEDSSENEVMTIKETATYLKVSVPVVRDMIACNDIPYFRRGQVIRLKRSDIREWMRGNIGVQHG
ncbi:helix-turn-helix domain-containing protein [Bacillus sp. H-16]|uniref:helix-turn-helix domain-containing protein n=1 Tax=Alteribacter salitolerans TaxID=2912333 RepID=UPI0019644C9B|nr:helix-turn-helix domain-containing protein [Alteribacter salitolerans]MBM7096656.1 helix-turn-helix domain-containing protein [Alteribacter salitolerans]